jgi:hypothetical protein
MNKFLKDPLLHFLVLGVALFALFDWSAGDKYLDFDQIEEIVITEGRVQSLAQKFEKVWMRPATGLEMEGLIEDHIREEVLYREALAMGLDRDDVIVRRRMRQKIEFLSEDVMSLAEPKEEELQEFLTTHSERFRLETRISFRQVYLNDDDKGRSAETEALTLLTKLRERSIDAATAGDRIMIEHNFESESEREIERLFGDQFSQAMLGVQPGSWQGPVVSAYGLHLVYISDRVVGEIPELAEISETVEREWSAENRKVNNEAFYQTLRDRYKVTIERSETKLPGQLTLMESE